jgi:hypothetical protein
LYFWANVFLIKCYLGNCFSGQMSLWANVFLGNRPSRQTSSGQISFRANEMSFWADVLLGNCLLGKCLSGQMSFLGKCLLGKCLSGQMSFCANVVRANEMFFWANVVWANVSGQMSLGKCLWANVVWANVMEPFKWGQVYSAKFVLRTWVRGSQNVQYFWCSMYVSLTVSQSVRPDRFFLFLKGKKVCKMSPGEGRGKRRRGKRENQKPHR